METSLVVLWLVAASEAYVARENEMQAGLFCAFAALTRPDAILLPVLFVLYELLFRHRVPWKALLAFWAIVGPWLFFAQIYFGNVVPNSIAAKSNVYFLHPLQAIATLLGFLATRSPLNGGNWPSWAIGISLGLTLTCFVVGAVASMRVKRRVLPVIVYPVAYLVGLSIGNPLLFFWYYPPFILMFDVFTLIGLADLFRRVSPRARSLVMAGGIGVLVLLQWLGLGDFQQRWPVDLRQREMMYAVAAAELDAMIEPGSQVALPEIGVFGYVFDQATIIDTVGLVSPEASRHRLMAPAPNQEFNYAISNDVIDALRPDYLITLEIFARPTLLRSPDFLSTYDLIRTFDAADFDSRGLLVFKRKNEL